MKSCIILFAFLSCLSIYDATLLWRINVDPPAYLFGTVHLPYTDIWSSLSDTAKSAFYDSTHFLPEFDVTNFFSSMRIRMCLSSLMSSMKKVPPPPGIINGKGQQIPLLDIYLTVEARRTKKTIQSLESAEIYCEFTKFQIQSLNNNSTSNTDKSSFPNEKSNEGMKRAYNCDLNNREEMFTPSGIDTEDKTLLAFKQRLEEIVGRRDALMAQKIDSLLKEASSSKRFFFATGFVHLMSPTGIIAKLRREYNYTITRLCTDPVPFRTTLGCQGPSWCDSLSGL